MENIEARCREKADDKFFTRQYPLLGCRPTKVKAYAYIAEGYTFYAKPEKELINLLTEAERAAVQIPPNNNYTSQGTA